MYRMFDHAVFFNQPIGNWNSSSVAGMGVLFNSAEKFNHFLGSWATSSVFNMYEMFYCATSLYEMFYIATSFNQPIGNWDTSQVT